MRVIAIIPAKGTSRRLPGKNLLPFAGATLLGHKIDQLRQCRLIDEVVVGSDCDDVLAVAARHGASTRKRDAYHCDEDTTPLRDRWRNLVAMVDPGSDGLVVWAHCTNPLVGPEVYDAAIETILPLLPNYDSLCSVTTVQRHAWQRTAGNPCSPHPVNFDPWRGEHAFAADLEPFYFQNGAIFIQPHRQMLENGYFYGLRPLLFEVPEPYGLDVDTESDLWLARTIYTALHGEPGESDE